MSRMSNESLPKPLSEMVIRLVSQSGGVVEVLPIKMWSFTPEGENSKCRTLYQLVGGEHKAVKDGQFARWRGIAPCDGESEGTRMMHHILLPESFHATFRGEAEAQHGDFEDVVDPLDLDRSGFTSEFSAQVDVWGASAFPQVMEATRRNPFGVLASYPNNNKNGDEDSGVPESSPPPSTSTVHSSSNPASSAPSTVPHAPHPVAPMGMDGLAPPPAVEVVEPKPTLNPAAQDWHPSQGSSTLRETGQQNQELYRPMVGASTTTTTTQPPLQTQSGLAPAAPPPPTPSKGMVVSPTEPSAQQTQNVVSPAAVVANPTSSVVTPTSATPATSKPPQAIGIATHSFDVALPRSFWVYNPHKGLFVEMEICPPPPGTATAIAGGGAAGGGGGSSTATTSSPASASGIGIGSMMNSSPGGPTAMVPPPSFLPHTVGPPHVMMAQAQLLQQQQQQQQGTAGGGVGIANVNPGFPGAPRLGGFSPSPSLPFGANFTTTSPAGVPAGFGGPPTASSGMPTVGLAATPHATGGNTLLAKSGVPLIEVQLHHISDSQCSWITALTLKSMRRPLPPSYRHGSKQSSSLSPTGSTTRTNTSTVASSAIPIGRHDPDSAPGTFGSSRDDLGSLGGIATGAAVVGGGGLQPHYPAQQQHGGMVSHTLGAGGTAGLTKSAETRGGGMSGDQISGGSAGGGAGMLLDYNSGSVPRTSRGGGNAYSGSPTSPMPATSSAVQPIMGDTKISSTDMRREEQEESAVKLLPKDRTARAIPRFLTHTFRELFAYLYFGHLPSFRPLRAYGVDVLRYGVFLVFEPRQNYTPVKYLVNASREQYLQELVNEGTKRKVRQGFEFGNVLVAPLEPPHAPRTESKEEEQPPKTTNEKKEERGTCRTCGVKVPRKLRAAHADTHRKERITEARTTLSAEDLKATSAEAVGKSGLNEVAIAMIIIPLLVTLESLHTGGIEVRQRRKKKKNTEGLDGDGDIPLEQQQLPTATPFVHRDIGIRNLAVSNEILERDSRAMKDGFSVGSDLAGFGMGEQISPAVVNPATDASGNNAASAVRAAKFVDEQERTIKVTRENAAKKHLNLWMSRTAQLNNSKTTTGSNDLSLATPAMKLGTTSDRQQEDEVVSAFPKLAPGKRSRRHTNEPSNSDLGSPMQISTAANLPGAPQIRLLEQQGIRMVGEKMSGYPSFETSMTSPERILLDLGFGNSLHASATSNSAPASHAAAGKATKPNVSKTNTGGPAAKNPTTFYGEKIDIWAVGCILIYLVTGEEVFTSDPFDRKAKLAKQFVNQCYVCGFGKRSATSAGRQAISELRDSLLSTVIQHDHHAPTASASPVATENNEQKECENRTVRENSDRESLAKSSTEAAETEAAEGENDSSGGFMFDKEKLGKMLDKVISGIYHTDNEATLEGFLFTCFVKEQQEHLGTTSPGGGAAAGATTATTIAEGVQRCFERHAAIVDVIRKCCSLSPDKRPTATQLLNMPFFTRLGSNCSNYIAHLRSKSQEGFPKPGMFQSDVTFPFVNSRNEPNAIFEQTERSQLNSDTSAGTHTTTTNTTTNPSSFSHSPLDARSGATTAQGVPVASNDDRTNTSASPPSSNQLVGSFAATGQYSSTNSFGGNPSFATAPSATTVSNTSNNLKSSITAPTDIGAPPTPVLEEEGPKRLTLREFIDKFEAECSKGAVEMAQFSVATPEALRQTSLPRLVQELAGLERTLNSVKERGGLERSGKVENEEEDREAEGASDSTTTVEEDWQQYTSNLLPPSDGKSLSSSSIALTGSTKHVTPSDVRIIKVRMAGEKHGKVVKLEL